MTTRKKKHPPLISYIPWFLSIVIFVALGLYSLGIPQRTFLANEPNVHAFGPPAGGKPDSLIILLHSSDGDGENMLLVAKALAPAFPHTVFVAPDGIMPSMLTPGEFEWYHRIMGDNKKTLEPKIQPAVSFVKNFIAQQMKRYRMEPSQVVVMGYSQGGVVALSAVPQLDEKIAGIITFAAYLVGNPQMARQHPPVLMTHGTDDRRIPFAEIAAAAKDLRAAGFRVQTYSVVGGTHDFNEDAMVEAAYAAIEMLTGNRPPEGMIVRGK